MTDDRFDPRRAAKKLLREARSGALASLIPGAGDPYCSLVNVATAADGSPLLLLSRLAVHTKNILADTRVSLMLDERKVGDPLEGSRLTLQGSILTENGEAARSRYLARQPDAAIFAGFKDFGFYRIALSGGHLVAGFGRIVDLTAAELLTDVTDADALLESEAEACTHMNEHHADAVRLYATKLLAAAEADWRCVGCDPEGLELQFARTALRLPFPQTVRSPGALRQALKQLAEQARAS
jgi:heme iron utilization protein